MKKSDQQSTGLLSAANLRNKIPAMLLCLIMVCVVIFPIMAATAQAAPSQSLAAWNITGAADVTSPTVQATSGAFQQDATLQLIRDGEPYTVSYTSGGVQAGAGGSTAASNLANMADSAWWVANLSATGYKDISVEWRMRSTNTGPRDFKVQYSTDNATWYDANDPTFQNSNDNGANPAITAEVCNFTGAKGKTLPSGADDQGMLYVRWLLTSNTAVNGSIVANGGTNTINNIVISGTPLSEGETDTTEVNILSFNDFHGQVEPAGSNPGAARFAACMNSLAGTYSNAFAVAGGDSYQGSAVSNYYQGKPVSDMLKAMNVAYSSLGNHEFDWGYDKIPQFAEDGNIDFVCSNLFHKGTDNRPAFVKPYAVKEIAGKKIGIIGFIVTETPVLVKAEYAEPFDFRAPGPWLADLVETLKQDGCDAVIALSHDGGTGLAGYGLAGVVNGHSHAYQAVTVGDTAFVQAGYNGRAVGRLQLVFDNETGACTATPSYVMINSLPADLLDAGMQAQIDWYLADSAGMFDTVVGQADIALSNQSVVSEWATGLVCDFIERQAGAPYVVIQNSGGWRSMTGLFLEQGDDINYRWLTVLMPFDNEIVLMDLPGSYLLDALNGTRAGGAGGVTTPPVVAGAYKQNGSWYLQNGTLIQPDGVYKVSCNDFMLTGGDNYDMFQYGTGVQFLGDKLRDALADEIAFRSASGSSDVTLVSLTRTNANAAAEAGNQFKADEGIFAGVSNLTAWNNNEQKIIGYQGTNRTPIVFNNAAAGAWQSVGSAVEDAGITVETASAFQIKFATTGYENIRFSCNQKSTGSGPEFFALAYSLGNPMGPYTPIDNSKRVLTRVSNDTYGALQTSYSNFVLPAELADQADVYLRVYMVDSTLSNRSNGNTSINDIVIIGDELGGTIVTPPFDAETLTLQPGANATSLNFNWYSDRNAVNNISIVKIAAKSNPSDVITVTGTVGDASPGKSWHKASVTGLARDTEYTYCVSNDGVDFSKMYDFKTGADGAFQFVTLGDPQLTTGNQDSDSIWPNPATSTKDGWQNTLDMISQYAPHAAFIAGTGDQVDAQSGLTGANQATTEAEYANYFAPVQLRGLPVAPAVGNHELNASAWPNTRTDNFNYHYNPPNVNTTKPDFMGNYWYTYNNALYVVLNTAPYPTNTTQVAELVSIYDAVLASATAACPDAKWLFVQHHKSTTSPASHQNDADIMLYAPEFGKLMDKYSVDFVLAGHDHVYSRSWFIKDNKKVDTVDYSVHTVTNPEGALYFTFTTASGLKYYDFPVSRPNNGPEWIPSISGMYTERLSGLNLISGKPWYTNVGIQIKAPQFTTVDVTDVSVTFKTYRTDTMAIIDEYTVRKIEEKVPVVVSISVSATVIKQNGNTNTLVVTATEKLSDGTTNMITQSFIISNNAKGSYRVGPYTVYVATYGNTKIDQCTIVK